MNDILVMARPDGGVSIAYFKDGVPSDDRAKLEVEYIANQASVGIETLTTHWVKLSDMPSDRYFRDAWTWED